jgi:colanic acid biosynthesis protein WcaH
MLNDLQFKAVIHSTPLISIDLIVRSNSGEVLLGKRLNRPAKGYWFVPGGRVQKNECLNQCLKRLLFEELGLKNIKNKPVFLGPYEHFYNDNFMGDSGTTHYIVLAYEILMEEKLNSLPLNQHSVFEWFQEKELLQAPEVHLHTKWYFMNNKRADNSF